MNIYQELYKQSRCSSKPSEDQTKKKCFVVWKDKRNEIFDSKRKILFPTNDCVSNEKENKKPNKNTLIKWKNERKNKAIPKKKPPFVVGVVRHKLYSPPFLNKSVKNNEKKKIVRHDVRQSFAPKNYKFKPPEGLKFNVLKPIAEKGTSSPFKNLFVTQNQITANNKVRTFENVTIRPRVKPSTPKSTKTKKEIIYQKDKVVKKILSTDDEDEPPIFGKLNLLKYKEQKARLSEEINAASTSNEPKAFNSNLKISIQPEDGSCSASYLNLQEEQESSCTKNKSTEKEYSCKPPTSYSCSQQIQCLLEQKDLRFTELHSNSESNQQIMKRTSAMPSPNLSRISFTSNGTDKENNTETAMEKNINENKENYEKNKSYEYNVSFTNELMNLTIQTNEVDIVDKETLIPENFNFEPIMSNKSWMENEEKDSNTNQDLPLPDIVEATVRRISEKRILNKNEDNRRSKEFNKSNSLNLTSNSTEFKDDSEINEKETQLSENEILLQRLEESLNSSMTSTNKNLETKINESSTTSNSNSADEEITCIVASDFIVTEKNMTSKTNVLSEQEDLKYAHITESIVAAGKEDNIVSVENIVDDSTFKLSELSPRDHKNSFQTQSKIAVSTRTSLENYEKRILEENNLNEPLDSLMIHEKSIKSQSSPNLTNDLNINKVKNKTKEDQPEIIDLSDSPIKQEKIHCEKNLVLSKLYDKMTESLYSSPQESLVQKPLSIENKRTEHVLFSIQKVERELSETPIEDKFSCPSIKETEKSVSGEDYNSSIALANNSDEQQNSQTDEIETVDLISDDEEDTSFLSKIKARYEITSPKLNPDRAVLASIENIQILRVSPRKTSRSPLLVKEISPTLSAAASPIRISSLRNKKIGMSSSPRKTKKSPRKILFEKHHLPDVNGQTPENNLCNLNTYVDTLPVTSLDINLESACYTPQSQVLTGETSLLPNRIPKVKISPETLRPQLLVKENSAKSSTTASPIRILSLRNRKISVSPSPRKTKKSPRKVLFKKNHLLDVNGQTPENNLSDLNAHVDTLPVSSLDINQESACNTPQSEALTGENSLLPSSIPKLKISPETSRPQLLTNTASPIRILSLRNRKISASPSPRKTKKTPRKALFTKKNLSEVKTPETNSTELNENRIAVSPLINEQNSTHNTPQLQEQTKENKIPILRISPCEVRSKLLVREKSPVSAVSSPIRILCLRSRKVDVTPSPKKKTPKKTPRGKKTPVK